MPSKDEISKAKHHTLIYWKRKLLWEMKKCLWKEWCAETSDEEYLRIITEEIPAIRKCLNWIDDRLNELVPT